MVWDPRGYSYPVPSSVERVGVDLAVIPVMAWATSLPGIPSHLAIIRSDHGSAYWVIGGGVIAGLVVVMWFLS